MYIYLFTYIYIYIERKSLSHESGTSTACTYEPISHKCANVDIGYVMICDSHVDDDYGCIWNFLVARGKLALHQFCF